MPSAVFFGRFPGGSVMADGFHVVTGAFGYSGRWIAKLLLDRGIRVKTLTNAIGRDDPFDGRVEVMPIDFENMDSLVESLRGAEVLYNTYWVQRYNKKQRVTVILWLQETARYYSMRHWKLE